MHSLCGQRSERYSLDGDGNSLDRVAAVAETVPVGPLGLGAAGKVGGLCRVRGFRIVSTAPTTASCTGGVHRSAGRLPRAPANGHGRLAPRPTRRHYGPRVHRQSLTRHRWVRRSTRGRAAGERVHARHRHHAPSRMCSGRSGRRPGTAADRLDLRQPLDRRHRIPAGNDQPDGTAMLQRQ